MKNFKESASLNATSEAMESKNHFKNAASPKSLMSRGKFMLAVAICSMLFHCGTASAQLYFDQLQFGVKAGLNVSTLSGLPDASNASLGEVSTTDPGYKTGFNIGVLAQYMLTEQFGIESGLYYSGLGAKSTNELQYQYLETIGGVPHYETETDVTTYSTHYLQLPITAIYKFNLAPDLYICPQVGIYLGYGLAGKMSNDVNDDEYNIFSKTTIETENYWGEINVQTSPAFGNRFDYGLVLGANLQYSNYLIGLGYDIGLGGLLKDKYVGSGYTKISKDNWKNVNFKITVGYLF